MTKLNPATAEKQEMSVQDDTSSTATLPTYQTDEKRQVASGDDEPSPDQRPYPFPGSHPHSQPHPHPHPHPNAHSRPHHGQGRRHHPHHWSHDGPPSPPLHEPMPHRGPAPSSFPSHAGGPQPADINASGHPEPFQWNSRWHPFFDGHRGRGHGRGGCRGGLRRGGAQRGRWGHGGMNRGGWFNGPWVAPFMQGLDALRQLDEDMNGDQEKPDVVPALDTFESEQAYTLHMELPGAKKADLGVHWDEEARQLRVSGVVHRPGSEEFLKTMTSEERQVGVFQRDVEFEKAIDSSDISAKLEDGVLVIIVAKAKEKEKKIEVRTVEVN